MRAAPPGALSLLEVTASSGATVSLDHEGAMNATHWTGPLCCVKSWRANLKITKLHRGDPASVLSADHSEAHVVGCRMEGR